MHQKRSLSFIGMFALAGVLTCLSSAQSASAVVLFDGSLGTSPSIQGLSYAAFPSGSYETVNPTNTQVDTSSNNAIQAGYSTTSVPLNRAVGFDVRVDVQIVAQSTGFTNANRSGFSLIALDGQARGIEIAFTEASIFAQNSSPLFVAAETVARDNTAMSRFDLQVRGETWTLLADNTSVLTGPVRDYSAFAGFPDVYETPNFLFIGDNTTSARGAWRVAYLSARNIPEPAMAGVLLACATLVLRRKPT